MRKPTTSSAERARFALVAALYKEQLGGVIADRRRELGLSQRELADRAGIGESQTVSRWERGLNAPVDLEAVARALETTAAEMLRGLEPINGRERGRLQPSAGTQLDRIEANQQQILAQLAELAERLPPTGEAPLTDADVRRAAELLGPQLLAAAQAIHLERERAPRGKSAPGRRAG